MAPAASRKRRLTASSSSSSSAAAAAHRDPGHPPRALFLIAHPDDETMFFTPTIAQYRRRGWELSVLCVSTGTSKGVGERRGRWWDTPSPSHASLSAAPAVHKISHPPPSTSSSGDYYGQGGVRRRELEAACRLLGMMVPDFVDHKNLQASVTDSRVRVCVCVCVCVWRGIHTCSSHPYTHCTTGRARE